MKKLLKIPFYANTAGGHSMFPGGDKDDTQVLYARAGFFLAKVR